MSDQPRYKAGSERREGLPRWVKVALIVAAVIVVLVVLAMFLFPGGGGGHGPQRHSSSAQITPRTSEAR